MIADGESVDIEFDPEEEAKRGDLMIVDEDENKIVWENLPLVKSRP